MQRFSSLFFILVAIFSVLLFPTNVEGQKNIQQDTLWSLEAGTKESNVVKDYCSGIDAQNVQSKGFLVSHGIITVAAVFHEAGLGLHAQNESEPFKRPKSVVKRLKKFSKAQDKLLAEVVKNKAVFIGGGLKQNFTDSLTFLAGKLDFFIDELAITMPGPYRDAINDVKHVLDGAIQTSISAFA